MDFGEVFTKAWKIIWKYKILWLFGIFASCSSGGGSGGGGGSSSSGAQYSGGYPPGTYNMEHIDPWLIVMIVIGLIFLGILIGIIVMAVSTVGRIGLVLQRARLTQRETLLDAHVEVEEARIVERLDRCVAKDERFRMRQHKCGLVDRNVDIRVNATACRRRGAVGQ